MLGPTLYTHSISLPSPFSVMLRELDSGLGLSVDIFFFAYRIFKGSETRVGVMGSLTVTILRIWKPLLIASDRLKSADGEEDPSQVTLIKSLCN